MPRVPLAIDGWNHNTHYHDYLLGFVPRRCRRALDVGCGLGGFARRLVQLADEVEALDRDPVVLARARELAAGVECLRFVEADFLTWRPRSSYDFVSMIATLHHLPFDEALGAAARLLNPGGTLAILGLERQRSVIGAAVQAALAWPVSGSYRLTRATAPVGASTLEPEMTLDCIRRRSGRLLPGATVRRHLLWRYSLVWVKRGGR